MLARRLPKLRSISAACGVRHDLLSHALTDPDYGSRANVKAEYDRAALFRGTGLVTPVPEQITRNFLSAKGAEIRNDFFRCRSETLRIGPV